MIIDFYFQAQKENAFLGKRSQQNRDWMHHLVNEMLLLRLSTNPEVNAILPELENAVENQSTTAYAAAKRIIKLL